MLDGISIFLSIIQKNIKNITNNGISIMNIFHDIKNKNNEFIAIRNHHIIALLLIHKKTKINSNEIKVKIRKDQLNLLIVLK